MLEDDENREFVSRAMTPPVPNLIQSKEPIDGPILLLLCCGHLQLVKDLLYGRKKCINSDNGHATLQFLDGLSCLVLGKHPRHGRH